MEENEFGGVLLGAHSAPLGTHLNHNQTSPTLSHPQR